MQWFAPEFRKSPLTYYAPDSGIGLTLENCCANHPKRVGIIGLGAGTIAAYGKPGDHFTFYEINPAVQPVAENLFTYMRESQASINVIEGDARISLANQKPQNYDVLAVDAFSGDAIPLHLHTSEALTPVPQPPRTRRHHRLPRLQSISESSPTGSPASHIRRSRSPSSTIPHRYLHR